VVVLSPLVAGIIAQGGYSKQAVKEYLFQNARLTAAEFRDQESDFIRKIDLGKLAAEGRMLQEYCTTDLTQMLPIITPPMRSSLLSAAILRETDLPQYAKLRAIR